MKITVAEINPDIKFLSSLRILSFFLGLFFFLFFFFFLGGGGRGGTSVFFVCVYFGV